jgi:copper chaperone CopZ
MQKYYISGMHCQKCANKATELIYKVPGISFAHVSLITAKLSFESTRDIQLAEFAASLANTKFAISPHRPALSYMVEKWFGRYRPLVIVFSVIVLWTIIHQNFVGASVHGALTDFMAGFFLILGGLKVVNWKNFAEGYRAYDPIAIKFPEYAYAYPLIEVFLGFAYLFGFGNQRIWDSITIIILSVANIGIWKVLARKENIQCACLGGFFSIPITWFTIFENAIMIAMALYMTFSFYF